jgi:hypothetical protein
MFEMTERVNLGGGDSNGPKQRAMRRLGCMCVIFFSFVLFFWILTNVWYSI